MVKMLTELVLVILDTANFVLGIFSILVGQLPSFLEVLEVTFKTHLQFTDMKRTCIMNLDARRQFQRKVVWARSPELPYEVRH